jgi:hypothetical protein
MSVGASSNPMYNVLCVKCAVRRKISFSIIYMDGPLLSMCVLYDFFMMTRRII